MFARDDCARARAHLAADERTGADCCRYCHDNTEYTGRPVTLTAQMVTTHAHVCCRVADALRRFKGVRVNG